MSIFGIQIGILQKATVLQVIATHFWGDIAQKVVYQFDKSLWKLRAREHRSSVPDNCD